MSNILKRRRRRFLSYGYRPIFTLIILSLAITLGITACARNDETGNETRAQSYGNDGYLGLSNANPRLPNRYGQQLNYGSDAMLVRRKLIELGGIDDIGMTFQGNHLYVSLKAASGIDELQLRQKAATLIRSNMPRYIVHVNTVK